MKVNRIKSSVLTVASLLVVISSGSLIAKETDYQRTQKELKIMSKIFETSLAEQSSKANRLYGSKKTEATYLAKQGMLFTFNFGRHSFSSSDNWGQFGEGVGHLVDTIAIEVGSALSNFPEAPDVVEYPEKTDDGIEQFEAYQERIDALQRMREQHREQREEVREIQRQVRSLEREHSNEALENKELKKIKFKLEEKMNSLSKKMNVYKKSMQNYREKRKQKFTVSNKLKSNIIISTLCDYGTTLRSLKSNEHVTVIFKNYIKNKNQVYVFNYNEVRNCQSKEELLESALSYQL